MNVSEFFDLTPFEINLRIDAYNKHLQDRYTELHALGTLVAIGVNNPKEFPPLEQFVPKPSHQKKVETDELSKWKERIIRRKNAWRAGSCRIRKD